MVLSETQSRVEILRAEDEANKCHQLEIRIPKPVKSNRHRFISCDFDMVQGFDTNALPITAIPPLF